MGHRAGARASLLAQILCRHCHRQKTNTNRSCLREEGQDRATDSNTAPTSASPLGQSSAPEQTTTRSFRAKQELNPLISQSCTAQRAAKLFSRCTSSSPSRTVTLLLLYSHSHMVQGVRKAGNICSVSTSFLRSHRQEVDGQAEEQDRDMGTLRTGGRGRLSPEGTSPVDGGP